MSETYKQLEASNQNGSRHSQFMKMRKRKDFVFNLCCYVGALLTFTSLLVLILAVLFQGVSWISPVFFWNYPSRLPQVSGIFPALLGSLWILGLVGLFSIPTGIAIAITMEELMTQKKWKGWLYLQIQNLAGVPSVVYGLIGLHLFVRQLRLGSSVLAGALALSLLILPTIILVSIQAIRSIPQTVRWAAYALGRSRWEVALGQVLPAAMPQILTGVLLAMGRAMGETAPLLLTGAAALITFPTLTPLDAFTALPVQIFAWTSKPQKEFHELAALSIVVLMGLIFMFNAVTWWLRGYWKRRMGL